MNIEKQMIIDGWEQTRLIAFVSASPYLKDKNISIYEWYPLPSDPTPEERTRIKSENIEKESARMKEIIRNMRKQKHI